MNTNTGNLKTLLLDYLKSGNNKQKKLQLDCYWSKNLLLSDHKNYFFVSKTLKKLLKDNEDVPEDRTFRVTLNKWSFTETGTRTNRKVDLDVQKYTVKSLKSELDFSKRTRDLNEYKEIENQLEVAQKKTTPKESVKKQKAKTNEKVKNLKSGNVSVKKVKETPKTQKIKKKSPKTVRKSPLRKRSTTEKKRKQSESDEEDYKNGLEENPILQEIDFIDLVQTNDYIPQDRIRSATKELRFQTPDVESSRVISPYNCAKQGLKNITLAFRNYGKIQPTENKDNLPDCLRDNGFSMNDYLLAFNGGKISGNEIMFSKEVISLVLKRFGDGKN